VDDKIIMNDIITQIESILKLKKLPPDDNLYLRIIEAIRKNGIDSFSKFKEEISPIKYNAILNSLQDLVTKTEINKNKDERIYDFNNFIEQYLKRFNMKNEDHELQSKIKKLFIEKMLESFQEFENRIDFVKLVKKLLTKNENMESNSFNSITKFLKSFLVDLKITTDENLILKMINHALDCFRKVLINFEDEISPKNMNELVSSINLEIDQLTANKENILLKLKEKLSKMPVCFEENVLSLMFFLNLKKEKEVTSLTEFQDFCNNLDEDISNKLTLLSERLKIEQDNNEDLKNFHNELLKKIKFEEWDLALKLLESILKKIRPLDIGELTFLMEKAKEAADKIKDQDVILLMGKTGINKIFLFVKIKKLYKHNRF
jgi:hypothetical protein